MKVYVVYEEDHYTECDSNCGGTYTSIEEVFFKKEDAIAFMKSQPNVYLYEIKEMEIK